MPPDRVTRLATPDDRSSVVALVVDAFVEDPAFRYFFGDDHEREAPPAVGAWFDRRVVNDTVWVAVQDDAIAGLAMWEVLDHAHVAPPADGDAASEATESTQGSWARMARYHAVLDPHLPEQRHWYLGLLAVAAPARGTGVARAVVAPGLAAAAAEAVPAVLETTNPENVSRYRHWGWRVTAEIETEDVPLIWVLRKGP